jgi:hypothetical protein
MVEEIPFEIFLNIGKQLCNETDFTENQKEESKKTKTYEEYKNDYKSKLEFFIEENKKTINKLDDEIIELEKNFSKIINLQCNKKISNNSLNMFYTNRPMINYLISIKSLESEKIRYYDLKLQNLKEQHEVYIDILDKNYLLWNKINNT